MKKLFLLCLALIVLPTMAFAVGIDLSWKDCFGGANSVNNQNFTCTGTANQNYDLFFQFKLPRDLPTFVAVTAFADLQTSSGVLNPFQRYDAGGCNNTGSVKGIAIFDLPPATAPDCLLLSGGDPWGGDGSGGTEAIAAYGLNFYRPGNGHFILLDAAGSASPLTGQANYYAFHLRFNNKNRVACAGCTDQWVLVWNLGRFESTGENALDLHQPDKNGTCVSGNNAPNSQCGPVPTKNTTWGKLKALYR